MYNRCHNVPNVQSHAIREINGCDYLFCIKISLKVTTKIDIYCSDLKLRDSSHSVTNSFTGEGFFT